MTEDMDTITPDKIIETSNEVLDKKTEEPKSLEQFISEMLENPQYAAKASQYLLAAIKHFGQRTVIEQGEEKTRWCFFDDPTNDGEHAILGNTEQLNKFVERLQQLSNENVEAEDKILWFEGPTATGKTEFRKCITNGLKAFSQTEQGKRYTLEWNTARQTNSARGMTYGDGEDGTDQHWTENQVQVNPIAVLPEEVRETLAEEVDTSLPVGTDLDPFSKESYRKLKRRAEEDGEENVFSSITARENLRVVRYVVSEGRGVGVLQSEDEGQVKQRLVGSWMPQLFGQLGSVGRKNPQAFSYDGVLSQGNSNVTFIEEASQHAELLHKFLTVPEDGSIKLDQRIPFDVDSVFIILSNPDFSAQITKHADGEVDPLKSLRRRLDKFELNYLLSYTLEGSLIKREIGQLESEWKKSDETIQKPVDLSNVRLCPHTVEAFALTAVVSRLDKNDLDDLTFVQKALLFENGEVEIDGEMKDKSEFVFSKNNSDGRRGIPVTSIRDVILSLEETDTDVYTPQEALEVLFEEIEKDSLFTSQQADNYNQRGKKVLKHICEKQEEDVLQAVFRDREVKNDKLEEYIEQVEAWRDDDEEEYDALKLKVFETRHLGYTDEDYDGSEPNDEVKEFREDKVGGVMSGRIWDQRDEGYSLDEINYKEMDIFAGVIGTYSWEDVFLEYENFDPQQWDDASEGTETYELKQKTIQNMQEMYDYTEEGARKTARFVIERVNKDAYT